MTNIDGKHSKLPYLHVKHENTCKTGIKMIENTFFSQIDKMFKIVSRVDECISFPFFRIPESILNVPTVIHLFRRKVTKSTVIVCELNDLSVFSIVSHDILYNYYILVYKHR